MGVVDLTVAKLLEQTADEDVLPGGGTIVALTAAAAAALTAMVARRSIGELGEEAEQQIERADDLLERLEILAQANHDAYAEAARSLGRIEPEHAEQRERQLT